MTFSSRSNPTLNLILSFGGGIIFLIMLLIMVAGLFLSNNASPLQPGLIGGLSVIPIMLFARGLFLLRGISSITLDPNGLHIKTPLSEKFIPWHHIHRLQKKERSAFLAENYDVLILLDENGKELAELRDTLDRFPELVQQIENRSTLVHGASIAAPPPDHAIEFLKARRKSKLLGSLFALFTLGMIGAFSVSLNARIHEKKFPTEAIRTTASILNRRIVGQTPRLEYEFKDSNGITHRRETMMHQHEWDALSPSAPVQIEYLPSDPSWSRLLRGEDDIPFSSLLPITIIGMVMFGFFTITSFLGFDMKTKNGKIHFTRFGRSIRQPNPTSSPNEILF